MEDDQKVTYFAETDFRNKKTKFGIKAKDRTRHMYVIGKTGMGKSTILENMAIQDIQNGEGVAFIDPHGGTAEKLLDYVPEHRIKDVVYFAPFDAEYPMSFNVLEDIGADKRHLVVSGLMSVFKKIWQDAWSARMEYILNNTLLALLEYPGSTLMGVNKMLSDKDFRKKIVDNVKDPAVKSFWVDEYAKYTERMAAEAVPAIQNKIGQYTLNPLIRNIIGQPKSSFDIRELMDTKKIFIINLSKGKIGEQNMNLLGGMFVTKIYLAAMSRADLSEKEIANLPPFYFYVDEFQNFANESFAQILSEARKYKLSLTVANQYVTQMVEEVRDAILGNVGSLICYRVGPADAELFEKEFAPKFTAEDIVNLGQYQMYLKLMVDSVGSQPFSARGMAPIPRPEVSYREQIIAHSREAFAHTRAEVEEAIAAWHAPVVAPYVPREGGDRGEYPKDRKPMGNISSDRGSIGNFARKPQSYGNDIAGGGQKIPYRDQQSFQSPRKEERRDNFKTEEKPMMSRQEMSHAAPKMPPRIKEEAPIPAPKKPFSNLKDLLGKLESTDKEENDIVPQPKEISAKPQSASLSSLRRPTESKKAPSAHNMSALKDVLSQAMKEREASPEIPKKQEEIKKPEAKEEKKDIIENKAKEIPEDVLRKILE